MSSRPFKTLTLFLAGMCMSTSTWADIGPKPRNSGSGLVATGDMQGIQVEMSSEAVELVLSKDPDSGRMELRVKFVARAPRLNDSDTPQDAREYKLAATFWMR